MSIRVSDIFHLLNKAGVAYVVVGGVAVNLHGHTRFTKDLDLIIGSSGLLADLKICQTLKNFN